MPRKSKIIEEKNIEKSEQVNPICSPSSCPSPNKSLKSIGIASTCSRRSNKSVLVMAKLEQKHRKRELELERALMDAERKLEMAKLNAEASDNDDSEPEPTLGQTSSRIHEYLEDCSKKLFPTDVPQIEKANPSSFSTLIKCIELPKVELCHFDGNCVDYLKFIKQFEFYVESRTSDDGQRLLYLMHYCRGRARHAIEECILLPPSQAYIRARGILKDLFGQKYLVARSLIEGLMNDVRALTNSADALSMLSIKMQNCSISLKQMDYEADLNGITTLERIVENLPSRIQYQWADYADKIAICGREPNFDDLTAFVAERSRVASSRFGQLAEGCSHKVGRTNKTFIENKVESRVDAPKLCNRRSFVTTNTLENRVSCRLCKEQHALTQCPKFLGLTVQERWNEARRLGACFMCLKMSHRSSECRSATCCDEGGCSGKHHRLMHTPATVSEVRTCNFGQTSRKYVRLGVLPVYVETPSGLVATYAFMDSGSDTTLVHTNFIKRHGISSSPSMLNISTLNGSQTATHLKVKLRLHSLAMDAEIDVEEAFTIDKLPIGPVAPVNEEAQRWPHLKHIHFDEIKDGVVEILIGCDVPEAHWAIEQCIGGRKQPFALRTLLGWMMCGPVQMNRDCVSVNYLVSGTVDLDAQLRTMYNLDFRDLAEVEEKLSLNDKRALSFVSSKTILLDGHYAIPLPWRDTREHLSNNRQLADKRLSFLKKRFLRDEVLRIKYQDSMQRHIQKGYIERVEHLGNDVCWYLPHHPVFNPKKPEKLRVVFDCAAKYNGRSLNDFLLQGPDLTANLTDVLLGFRIDQIAIAADIEEMFLQVKVPECDRDALRLLWWPEGDVAKEPCEYRMTVHPFGAVSSPFCANFALQKVAEDFGHLTKDHVSQSIKTNFYVDDFLVSVRDLDTATYLVQNLTELLSKGGFRLTKWISNSRALLSTIPVGERAPSQREITCGALPLERTLGICWDAETDEFVMSFRPPTKSMTRRGLLSAVSSIYDPLGFISPWILSGKTIIQELCRKRIGWDDPLTDLDENKWKAWLHNMQCLNELRIPRCIRKGNSAEDKSELHIFCDASEIGYGAVAYACTEIVPQQRLCTLLLSKARVAPLHAASVPRLELAAAVLAVRLWQLIQRGLHMTFKSVTFWTDSMIVLYYINNENTRFTTFVANRLSIIHSVTCAQQWRHVRSSDNPADRISRGMGMLAELEEWLRGPAFLMRPPCTWSQCSIPDRVEHAEYKRTALHFRSTSSENYLLHRLCCRYSDWDKLLKAVSWLTRFKNYWILMHARNANCVLKVGCISTDERVTAELDTIKMLQNEVFSNELRVLAKAQSVQCKLLLRKTSLHKLHPVLSDGIIRVGGRLLNSRLSFAEKHPIILPQRHPLTEMIIGHFHKTEGHSGTSHLVTVIRQRFWILRGVTAIRKVVNRCIFCRRQNAFVGEQLMAQLPTIRCQPGWHPFTHVGLDYFGPIEVKRGRSFEKRYGCLLTCLQSRAVHLEVAHSMSTDSFILLLTRFIGRRGTPTVLYSDNGSNFKCADKELQAWIANINSDDVISTLAMKTIRWNFNPPYASHRGGIWERLVKSVKRILNAVCHEQILTDETLGSFIIEVERILNNRPIVPQFSDDPFHVALTPNDLLLLRSNEGLKVKEKMFERYKDRWKQVYYLSSIFWKRWTKEYLPLMQVRQKRCFPKRNFITGDVVSVVSDGLKENEWPLGVVKNAIVDSDGLVRTVDVKTKIGVLRRDIRRICLLEGADETQNNKSSSLTSTIPEGTLAYCSVKDNVEMGGRLSGPPIEYC